MKDFRGLASLVIVAITLLVARNLNAAEPVVTPTTTAVLRELLDAGWQPSQAALEQTRTVYARLARIHAGEPALEYAYLLTLMRQKKFDEALDQSSKLLLIDKGNLATLRARVCLLMLQKNYSAAIVEAQTMAESLIAKRQPPLDRSTAEEYCKFLGRVHGFLAGPAVKDLNTDKLRESQAKLTKTLGLTGGRWFAAGTAEIQAKFLANDQELKTTKALTIAEENQRKEQRKVELAEQKINTAAEQQQRETELSAIQAEADAKLAQIDQELSPAQQQLAATQARYNSLQVQVLDLDNSIAYWAAAAANAVTPFEYDQAIYQLRLVENQRRAAVAALGTSQVALSSALAQVNQLQAQRDGVAAQYIGQIKALQKRLRELAGLQNRIASEEKKAAQPSTGSTTETLSLAGKVYGFLTYEEFPYEEERKRLLQP